jgi:hypothetical protein
MMTAEDTLTAVLQLLSDCGASERKETRDEEAERYLLKVRQLLERPAPAPATEPEPTRPVFREDQLGGIDRAHIESLLTMLLAPGETTMWHDAGGCINVLAERLRIAETRLRTIEDAVDGYGVEGDGRRSDSSLLTELEDRLRKVQGACPWDDENEHGSWTFPPAHPLPAKVSTQAEAAQPTESAPPGAQVLTVLKAWQCPWYAHNSRAQEEPWGLCTLKVALCCADKAPPSNCPLRQTRYLVRVD